MKNLENQLKVTDEEFEVTQELGTYFIILNLENIDDIGEANQIRDDLNELLLKVREGRIKEGENCDDEINPWILTTDELKRLEDAKKKY